MHIVIRKVSGQRMVVDMEDLADLSIDEVKQLIELEWSDLTSDEIVLIFKGKILKDDDVVKDLGIKDGATLILTKKKLKKKPAPKPVARPAPAPPQNPMLPAHMQEMMNNPMMQQMMDSMMSNPDFMEAMIANNPQMQAVMEQNPEIRHALRDPDTIRHAMQMIRDPQAMQEALQNQDRAIANISNMPGGFNALSRMYNQVQAPMEDAMTNRDPEMETSISEVDTSTGPNSSAMPNPFAQNNRPSNQPAPNPFANFGRQNNAAPNPFGNMFGSPMQNNNNANRANPFAQANNNNAFPMFNLFGPPVQTPPAQPDRFATQMTYLRNQGHSNEALNRSALEETDGNLELAIAIILAEQDDD
jgi:ubiquilin